MIRDNNSADPRFWDSLLWICPILSLGFVATLLWLFGLTAWTAFAIVLVLACPVVVAWVVLTERAEGRKLRGSH